VHDHAAAGLVAGSLLFVFGLQMARKGDPDGSRQGPFRGMGARNEPTDDNPAHGVDWIAFSWAFRGCRARGGAWERKSRDSSVDTFGAAPQGRLPSAASARADAMVINRRLPERSAAGSLERAYPRSACQHLVGTLLSAFGPLMGSGKGLGIAMAPAKTVSSAPRPPV